MRCFVAIDIDAAIRTRLEAVVARLRRATDGAVAAGARISWTRPSGWHVTLKFLGEVAEERLASIGAALASAVAGFGRFDMTLAGVHGFPAGRAPRVIAVGVRDDGKSASLAGRVEASLEALDFPREERPHVAHLTLARLRDRAAQRIACAAVEAVGDESFGSATVERVALYESRPGPEGSCYRELASFALVPRSQDARRNRTEIA